MFSSVTTIQLKRSTLEALSKRREPFDKTWDEAILKGLEFTGEFFLDVIAVDGEYGRTSEHDIIIQIGDDPPHYWRYRKGELSELAELPKMKVEVQ